MPSRALSLLAPTAFVPLWATGFVVARLVAPYAEPLSFLAVRFALAAAILAGLAVAAGARWPAGPRAWAQALAVGALLHGAYLGGVFWAVANGLPAGVSALIAATQPLLTAAVAGPLLGEAVGARRWAGVALGFAGVALVLAPRLEGAGAFPPATLLVSGLSTVGLTAGTVLQKRVGAAGDLRAGAATHYVGAAIVVALGALLTESGRWTPAPALWIGLAWSVLAMSIGAVGLLLLMIRRGAVVGVASLMFLVPPVSALMAYGLFGETLTAVQACGMALAAAGVALATIERSRPGLPRAEPPD